MPKSRTYVLILYLPIDAELSIEPLGVSDLPAGFYAYVGSVSEAGLANRLKHHLTPITAPKRPIDYLQQVTGVEEIWLSSSTHDHLHAWADLLLAVPGSITLIENFETDDCDCDTHLFYFDVRPMLEDFAIGVRRLFPADIVLRAFARDEAEEEGETQV